MIVIFFIQVIPTIEGIWGISSKLLNEQVIYSAFHINSSLMIFNSYDIQLGCDKLNMTALPCVLNFNSVVHLLFEFGHMRNNTNHPAC